MDAGHWSTCQYILSRSRKGPQHTVYCGVSSNGKSSYCDEHHALCYTVHKRKRKKKL